MVFLHILEFLLICTIVFFIYGFRRYHTQYKEIILQASELIESLERNEKRINIMIYNLEKRSRNDR